MSNLFVEKIAELFEEKSLLYDKILLLGDLNISLTSTHQASTLRNWIMEDFGLVQHEESETHEKEGFLTMS